MQNILSDLCAFRCEESADFLGSVALYIVVPSKDLNLISSTQGQLPVFLVCCPTELFYTKLQASNSKSYS